MNWTEQEPILVGDHPFFPPLFTFERLGAKCPRCGNDQLEMTFKSVAERHWACFKCKGFYIYVQANS